MPDCQSTSFLGTPMVDSNLKTEELLHGDTDTCNSDQPKEQLHGDILHTCSETNIYKRKKTRPKEGENKQPFQII